MQQNRTLAGAAEAIERTKNAGSDAAEEFQDAAGKAADRARRTYDDSRDAAQQVAHGAHDRAGEALRKSESYIRRHPIESVAVAAALAFVAGRMFRR